MLNAKPTPVLLSPVGKDYLWGGDKLNTHFGKNIPLSPLAETWECSVHADGMSVVVTGAYAGKTLAAMLREHPEYIGEGFDGHFPILIKFIDALKDLSVQVHPDDAYARKNEGDNGKSEMWYILDAEEGATLVYGFSHEVTAEMVRAAAENGTLDKHLNRIPVHAGDTFYIPAGTVHAIGSGILIAEIQENSNVTYRVYDYDRVDKDGNKRPLHMDKAVQVMDMSAAAPPRTAPITESTYDGYTVACLCDCPYFTTDRIVTTVGCTITVGKESFAVLLMVAGEGTLTSLDGTTLSARRGDCIFCPAGAGEQILTGDATWLRVVCKA